MLRILRAMQFLTLLMREVPQRVADERQRLELLFRESVAGLTLTAERTEAYQRSIETDYANCPRKLRRDLARNASRERSMKT